jgi:hypothetical protein
MPPDHHVGAPLVRSFSFATPLAVPATTNSVSSLSQSTKEASKASKTSAGKPDGPSSIAKSSEKRMKSNSTFDSEARTNYAPDKDDKEADYVPITNKASSNIMDGKTWEDDYYGITEKHRKAFYLKAFPPVNPDKDFEKSQSKSAAHKPKWITSSMAWRIGKWAQRFVPCRRVQRRMHCYSFVATTREGTSTFISMLLTRSGLQVTLHHVQC